MLLVLKLTAPAVERHSILTLVMRGSRKFCQGGPTLTTFFLIDRGREDPNTDISGPSSARHGPTLNAALIFRGSGPVSPRNPIVL